MASGVLRTRLLPPQPPPDGLPREALLQRLGAGLDRRLVVVGAGAGYGKSTALAQALARQERPWTWCSCDERLGDSRLLVGHLAAGLAERFPGFGAGMELTGVPEDDAAQLCNEILATVPERVVLALDDVHTLAGQPAGETLARLIADLPRTVTLALVTRRALDVPLARRRAAGELHEVGERELALSRDETASLLRAQGVELSTADADELHRRTEGWVAGVVMAAQTGGAAPLGPGADEDHLFAYMAEEVFERQPPDVRDFLLATCVLDRFDPALAEVVTGRPDARGLVRHLVRHHLFTARLEAEGEWYRYHHLFAAFLRRTLAQRGAEIVREGERRAAAAWSDAGEPVEAVRHFLAAGDRAAAVATLEPMAETLVHSPQADALAGWLEEIPRRLWEERPNLILAHASLLFARADYGAAFDALERAIDKLLGMGDHERAAIALYRLLGGLATVGGQQDRGIEAGRRHGARIDRSARMLPAALLRLATLYAYACRYAEAEVELEAAMALPAAVGSPAFRHYAAVFRAFYVDFPQGAGDAALRALDEAIEGLEAMVDDPLVLLSYAHAYRGIVLHDLGQHEACLLEAGRVQAAADRRGLGRVAVPVVAWLRFGALAGLGRWDELAEELERTRLAFDRLEGAVRGYLYPLAEAQLAAHRGDARAVAERAALVRAGLRSHGYAYEEAVVLCDLALAAVRSGQPQLAGTLVADARRAAVVAQGRMATTRASLVAAAVGDDEAADAALGDALERTERWGYACLWSHRDRPWSGRLLTRAITRGLGPEGTAARLAAACGGEVLAECVEGSAAAPAEARARLAELAGETVEADAMALGRLLRDRDPEVQQAARRAQARLAARPRVPVRLVTLGGFSVRRGDAPIPEAAFRRRKARAVLAALACARGPVHRERLVDWFWPELPVERGLAALYTTLHALRRALEPGLGRGARSGLVVGEGEAYRLVLGDLDSWDAAEFLALARTALDPRSGGARIERLETAEAAYGGPFLPEWPYEDWALERRAEVEEANQRVLAALADALMAASRPDAAVSRYQRLLALEPEREGWHRGLMRAYAATGELALALRQYHACRAALRHGQGTEPGRETRALYSALLSGGADG
jgi:DNA-binding SARP family transcriptional activator